MANQFINAMTALWNSSGTTYSAIKMNVTNSASAAGSTLIQLQTSTVDKFTVDKNGNVVAAGGITALGLSTSAPALPATNDGAALGSSALSWSDIYLASGGVINWNAGDVTVTHSSNVLTFGGASLGYVFDALIKPAVNDGSALGASGTAWSDLFLASGALLDFAANDVRVTHSTGVLTVAPGDIRITTAGTNAASVVTVGGTQTLTGKTLTTPTLTTPTINGATLTGTISGGTHTSTTLTSPTITTPTVSGGTFTGTQTMATIAATAIGAATVNTSGAITSGTTILAGGTITANSHFTSSNATTVLSSSGAGGIVILRPNGSASGTGQAYVDSNGAMTVLGSLSCTGQLTTSSITVSVGTIQSSTGYLCKAGTAGGFSNVFNWFWNNVNLYAFIDNVNVGWVALNSDYRIKKDIADLPSTWDKIKALRPISYTQAEYDPQPGERPLPLFRRDNILRWGFIAHEAQDTLLNSAASGFKDDPDSVQSLNWAPIVAALTKALQEAMTRIEALEGATA